MSCEVIAKINGVNGRKCLSVPTEAIIALSAGLTLRRRERPPVFLPVQWLCFSEPSTLHPFE
jgi:hypothetical protein